MFAFNNKNFLKFASKS